MRRMLLRVVATAAAAALVIASTIVWFSLPRAAVGETVTSPTAAPPAPPGPPNWNGRWPAGARGLDVSGWQENVAWSKKGTATFVFIKATEARGYYSRYFSSQWQGAGAAGLIRGVYHFADPSKTHTGAQDANWFFKKAGRQLTQKGTLPPVLDIEYDYHAGSNWCWGLTQKQMVTWIASFVHRIEALTHRTPIIYTAPSWWARCTGDSTAFGRYPLWVADYSTSAEPRLPAGWTDWTFRQFAAGKTRTAFPGDRDVFNGTLAQLKALTRK